ncbi:tRNA (guanine(37)-N1)-methyltransferase isoform X2 [Protopterus annectens]|uniref:tRNA (guanine(37)-N1)-methyltransferase isoform X2 n=1 Tax=Protopterus annectens TaxID=7888 RepID=UPI001CFC0DA8|nr:tRNA (guanine(37)-N1)-methyltransferase isoform X2 [Protopterus annectens]
MRFHCTAFLEMLKGKVEEEHVFMPPRHVHGMTELKRDAFTKSINVPALKVKKEIINRLMKPLKQIALQRPGLKRVMEDPEDENKRLIILDPCQISSADSFDDSIKIVLGQFGVDLQVYTHNLELTYENFKTEEILRAVLPEGQDVTSSFSRVGHIAHMNLREHQLPYRYLVGQVIIDKNPGVTSVVNKTNIIDNAYRNFQMELLAGEDNMITKVKENGFTYEFDFSKVYWNPRLGTEHNRIVALLKAEDIVFDVFAGVGPFAIPAAKKNCAVLANDLNPESCKWLVHNCKLNKVDRRVKTFSLDGRDFILGPLKDELNKISTDVGNSSVHIIMNLPALAIDFLDAFKNLLDKASNNNLPTVHCYGFSKDDNPAKDIKEKAESVLGVSLEGHCCVHQVRNVAPNKEMMCISFQLPAEVLYKEHSQFQVSVIPEENEPKPKRIRTDPSVQE